VVLYNGPVVDVDVHHRTKSQLDLVPYLPKHARELLLANPHRPFKLTPPGTLGSNPLSNGAKRADTYGPDGQYPGTSYELLRDQLLDPLHYFRAVLTHDVGDYAVLANVELGKAICSAANDWTIDHWLARDERLRALVVCPLADPDDAVAEIRRIGQHPQMDGVLLVGSPLGQPFGHPVYHRVYAAAEELGLPLAIHPATSDERAVPPVQTTTTQQLALASLQGATFVASFIVHGVFEQLPKLKVIVKEYGIAWVPSLLWRMDQHYDVFRRESSWVKRWPSEYVRDHVRFSTQPLEVGDHPRRVADFLEAIEGMDQLLCFSSDYPHISYDDMHFVARHLPASWTRRVMCDNACDVYGWVPPASDTPRQPEAVLA
jgi:predicted TIM-barrel fold metal-dependent hydrolase